MLEGVTGAISDGLMEADWADCPPWTAGGGCMGNSLVADVGASAISAGPVEAGDAEFFSRFGARALPAVRTESGADADEGCAGCTLASAVFKPI